MKKIFALILTLALVISMVPCAFAASDEAVMAANTLYELGLFNGTGMDENGKPIYDLDSIPTRNQAVTMLVRLLGKSDEAVSGKWSIPFADVAEWAKPYVGYAYANGLTAGTSATTYSGNQPTTVNQYLTFVLRALGYKSGTDFEYNKAWEFSDKIGLTDGRYNGNTMSFTRADIAIISCRALNCNLNSGTGTLLDSIQQTSKTTATDIAINGGLSQGEYLKVGETLKLSVTPTPASASLDGLVWSVGETSRNILSVSNQGIVTAIGAGIGFVWAEMPNMVSDFAIIQVKAQSPIKITNISDKMDSVGGTTFYFNLENTGNKSIKYATFYWYCKNAVGDNLYDTISRSDRFAMKLTGPLAPGEKLEHLYSRGKFYNYDFAHSIELIEIVIDYMDGTVEVVNPSNYYDYWDLG